MENLKSFIVNESAKASHALKFMQYEQDDHQQISKKIHTEIEAAWKEITSRFEDLPDDHTLEGRKSTILRNIDVVGSGTKISRFNDGKTASLAVSIGNAYDEPTKNEAKRWLLAAAQKILDKYATKLNKDITGNPFYASQEDGALGDVRLKFKTGDYRKTIILISVDRAYKNDTVYMRDFLSS